MFNFCLSKSKSHGNLSKLNKVNRPRYSKDGYRGLIHYFYVWWQIAGKPKSDNPRDVTLVFVASLSVAGVCLFG